MSNFPYMASNFIPIKFFTEKPILSTAKHQDLSADGANITNDFVSPYGTISLPGNNKVYKAALELMVTEEKFLNCITVLDVDFRNFITEQNKNDKIVPQRKFNEIFSNINVIRNFSNVLLNDFRLCFENCYDPYELKIAHVLVKEGAFLKMYAEYSKDYYKNIPLFQELVKKYPKFKKAVRQFENHDCCENKAITWFFDEPFQRIPRYQLLMKEYLKQISNECNNCHPDKADAEKALDIVTSVAVHVNEHIGRNEKFQELLELKERLGDPHNLIQADRYLLHHGKIKRRDKKGNTWCYLILLNDSLIIAELAGITTKDINIPETINQSLYMKHLFELKDVSVEETQTKEELPDDFHVNGPYKSFIFVGNDKKHKDKWMQMLSEAINDMKMHIGAGM